MTKEEFFDTSVTGVAKILQLVRDNPGITQRQILARTDNKYATLTFLYMACCQELIFEDRFLWIRYYYPEGYH